MMSDCNESFSIRWNSEIEQHWLGQDFLRKLHKLRSRTGLATNIERCGKFLTAEVSSSVFAFLSVAAAFGSFGPSLSARCNR